MAGFELDAVGREGTGTDLRTGKVDEDADRATDLVGDGAHLVQHLEVVGELAVTEVEAYHVDTGRDQPTERLWRVAGRSDRGDDLRAPGHTCLSSRRMDVAPDLDDPTADLRRYLDDSPSPWHAVATTVARLAAAGFTAVSETEAWPSPVERGYVVRGGALVAWRRAGTGPAPVRVIGAHTDSPGLRVKPNPDLVRAGWRQLGIEIYGGVLLNSWLDRDLGLAGRVLHGDGRATLVRVDEPIARVPQLAIHLDRDVNERGLLLDRHAHTVPVWATQFDVPFEEWLTERAGTAAVTGWELVLYDVQPAAVIGADRSLLASGRLDNLASCWAATTALVDAEPGGRHRRDRPVRPRGGRLGQHDRRLGAVPGVDPAAAARRHRRVTRRLPPHDGGLQLRVGGQRPRRPSQLPRAPRSRSRPARQPGAGDQAQRQPALRDVGRHGRPVPAGL